MKLVAYFVCVVIAVAMADHHDDLDHHDNAMTSTAACSKAPDTGDCGGSEPRWFFHYELDECRPFTHKGCNGSPNNFASKDECEMICLDSSEDETVINPSNNNKELEQNENSEKSEPEATESKPEVEDNEDEEDYDEIEKEQDELVEQFNMADKDDMITLERLMQDPVMDIGEIFEEDENYEAQKGEIQGFLYSKADDISAKETGKRSENNEPTEESNTEQFSESNETPENDKGSKDDGVLEDTPVESESSKNSESAENQFDDDESIYETELEQDELVNEYGSIASKDDLIQLENLLQNDNIDIGEVIETNDEEERGDVSGFMYRDADYAPYENAHDDDELSQEFEEGNSENTSELTPIEGNRNEKSSAHLPSGKPSSEQSETESSPSEEQSQTETVASEEQYETEAVLSDDEDEEIQDTLSMEDKLEQDFSMADVHDLLALERIVQDQNMDMSDILERADAGDLESGDIEGVMEVDDSDQLSEYEDDTDEQQDEEPAQDDSEEEAINSEYRQHSEMRDPPNESEEQYSDEVESERERFNFADDQDYITVENLMSNGNMEEMEVDEEPEYDGKQLPAIRGSILYERYDAQSVPSEERYGVELEDDYDIEAVPSEDNYDEDTVPSEEQYSTESAEELTKFDQDQDNYDDEEETLKMEEQLENKFGMADSNDLQTLEGLVQEPEMSLMDLIPQEKSGRPEDGDIEGVLSLAASFLGKEDRRDIKKMQEQVRESIAQAENRVEQFERNEDDHIWRKETEMGVIPTTQPMISLEKASYNDKSMLMSVLQNDLLRVNKIRGSRVPTFFEEVSTKFDKKRPMAKSGFRSRGKGKYRGARPPKCCMLPKDPGPCKADMLQWHYDPFIGTCLPFHYGGCRGNRNRFDTIGACLRKCGGVRENDEKMSPDPIAEPPIVRTPDIRIKSVVSSFMPKKLFRSGEVLTPGQDKFMRMLSNAVKHVTDIKPIRISPVTARAFVENDDGKRPPIPLKSVMFKWPIIRMIFDKRAKTGKLLPPRLPMEAKEGLSKIMRDERFPPLNERFPPLKERFSPMKERFPPLKERFPPLKERFPPQTERFPLKERFSPLKEGFPPMKERFPPSRENKFPMSRDNRFPKARNGEFGPKFDMPREHFAPSFRKEFKVMSHHEDNSHRMTSDPKNKVNLIQVFVNKPHNEAKAEPQHHSTVIKKHQFSSGGDYHALPNYRPPFYPHPYRPAPPFYPPPRFPPFAPRPEEHTHEHTHDDGYGPSYSHSHPHFHHPPHFHDHFHHHPPPWAPKYDRPHLDSNPHSRNPSPREFHPNMRPSTSYPDVDDEEPEVIEQEMDGDEFEEGTDENVVVVTVQPGDDIDEPNYACLLPRSTGMCKAFEEKFYYNIETRSCELFVYGGCGGNANNFHTRHHCQATCMRSTPVPGAAVETTTLPDDTIYITSPVYVEDACEEQNDNGDKQDGTQQVVEGGKFGNSVKDSGLSAHERTESEQPEHIEVYAEPVSLLRSSQTEYIIIVVVMGFVGLAAAALVCLAVANLSRRLKTTKKEKVIEAVIASHLERSSCGSETPRMIYYGQPPSETGPPPITDVPQLHKDKLHQDV